MTGRLRQAARHLAALLLIVVALPAFAQDAHWTTAWATAPVPIEQKDALTPAQTSDATLRQTVLMTLPASRLRVRFTNRHGTEPLEIAGVHVARAPGAGAAAMVPGSDVPLTFRGEAEIVIPEGADYVSDPIEIDVPALSHLAITIHYAAAPGRQTGHPGSRTTGYVKPGNALADAAFKGAAEVMPWFNLAAVEVEGTGTGAIAILGDSITDGYGVKPSTDTRWPDFLARRLQASPATRHLGVANLGIGGNRLLLDGLGPNGMARFDRDVLALAGVRYLIVLIGVNDLGTLTREGQVSAAEHQAHLDRMLDGYAELVRQARERGIQVIGATILPYGGSEYYHPDPPDEAKRQAINAWIRAPGNFDAVIDFDAVMRDPARPTHLKPEVDSGDGLHPSPQGYRVMAEAVPLDLFAPAAPRIVLTFDDLPEHGPIPAGETAQGVADAIISALKAANVDQAYGFVNGAKLARDPALAEVLSDWRAAGYALANHGWSHARIDDLSLAGFTRELTRNEAVLGDEAPRYFRYPFLAEGRDPALRDAARRILADRGYAIAPVGMDFSDWAYNTAYARCRARGDGEAIKQLESAFLAHAKAAASHARTAAQGLYGRDIPYVLLLHGGAFTAHMLPRLLDLYDEMGFTFGNLDAALADPALAASRNPGLPSESATLNARAGVSGPEAPIDVARICG